MQHVETCLCICYTCIVHVYIHYIHVRNIMDQIYMYFNMQQHLCYKPSGGPYSQNKKKQNPFSSSYMYVQTTTLVY